MLNKIFVYEDNNEGFGSFYNLSKIVDESNNEFIKITNDVSSLLQIDTSSLFNNLQILENDVSLLKSEIKYIDSSIIDIIDTLSYGYSIFVQANQDTASDNDLIYFCSTPNIPSDDEFLRAVIVPRDGKIIGASLVFNVYSGGVGSSEDVSVWVRKNRSIDYHIATVGDSSALRIFNNFNMNLDVSQGDILSIKVQHPNYSTNPGFAAWSGNLFLTSPIS